LPRSRVQLTITAPPHFWVTADDKEPSLLKGGFDFGRGDD
jgi:hypothetical protein